MGYPMTTTIRARSWTRSRAHADLRRGSFERLDEARQHPVAVRRPMRPMARPSCTSSVRAGQGQVPADRVRADRGAQHRRFPLMLTTGPDPEPVQRRRADPPHGQRRLAPRGPAGDPSARRRGPRHHRRRRGDLASRVGETKLRAQISDRMPTGVVYTTFHHPVTGANVVTTENSDWATNCPEYKVTAVQVGLARPAVRDRKAHAQDGVLAVELVD